MSSQEAEQPAIERVAVVTGAASGIGKATAELFAERGYKVVAVDLVGEALSWTGGNEAIVPLAGDVSQAEANAAMVALALERFGRLDVAILNAGVVGSPPIEADGAIERLDTVLGVNVRGVVLGIRHSAPALRAAGGGAIVATASTSGLRADPGSWAYNASKAAVINLVRAAAMDYALDGIRINAVAPGPTDTGMTRPLVDRDNNLWETIKSRVPMQRYGTARELAEAFWFLASPAASFITGETLVVDGGLSANAGHFPVGRRTTM